jgi:hypothetical protein
MLLTLTAGVWGGALASAASAWCAHEAAGATRATDGHDCCRARIGDSDAHHPESQATAHDASTTRHENSTARQQADEAHAGMNCAAGADTTVATPDTGAASLVARGLPSCAECCAGGSGQTPAAAFVVAPEAGKVKRDAGVASASARHLFAPASSHVSPLAPSQHAPPAPPGHRHILISVFLI